MLLLMNGADRPSDEPNMVTRAAPDPTGSPVDSPRKSTSLFGPASLSVFHIILQPVEEGSRALASRDLTYLLNLMFSGGFRAKKEGVVRMQLSLATPGKPSSIIGS